MLKHAITSVVHLPTWIPIRLFLGSSDAFQLTRDRLSVRRVSHDVELLIINMLASVAASEFGKYVLSESFFGHENWYKIYLDVRYTSTAEATEVIDRKQILANIVIKSKSISRELRSF